MCFIRTVRATDVVAYKIVRITRQEMSSPYRGAKIKPGWNLSSRKSTAITPREVLLGKINLGAHAWRTRRQARVAAYYLSGSLQIIEVWIPRSAVVDMNKAQIVSTKYFVSAAEYRKALKGSLQIFGRQQAVLCFLLRDSWTQTNSRHIISSRTPAKKSTEN